MATDLIPRAEAAGYLLLALEHLELHCITEQARQLPAHFDEVTRAAACILKALETLAGHTIDPAQLRRPPSAGGAPQ